MRDLAWVATDRHQAQADGQALSRTCTCSLALKSEGCMSEPMTLTLPCTTSASSGLSVLMPTRPWWKTVSGTCARCQSTSLSLSNWPGLEA